MNDPMHKASAEKCPFFQSLLEVRLTLEIHYFIFLHRQVRCCLLTVPGLGRTMRPATGMHFYWLPLLTPLLGKPT